MPAIGQTKPKARSVLARLHAWWEGYDVTGAAVRERVEHTVFEPGVARDGPQTRSRQPWGPERINAVERLFGTGLGFPGGEAFVAGLVRPLGLNKEASVVEFGAFLGGTARTVARETGAWIDSTEVNAELAVRAEKYAEAAGLRKKASIVRKTPELADIKDRSRDAVLIFNSLMEYEDKDEVLTLAHRMMKPGGHLLIVDLFRRRPEPTSPAIEFWSAYETVPPALCEIGEFGATLKDLRFDVRVIEDLSETYRESIAGDLRKFLVSVEDCPLPHAEKPWLSYEVEFWARRAAVLESGDVGLFRVHACLPDNSLDL